MHEFWNSNNSYLFSGPFLVVFSKFGDFDGFYTAACKNLLS